MIIRTQQDIWNSQFVGKLDKVAKDFGCGATYVSAENPPDIKGLYVAIYTNKKYFPSAKGDLIRKLAQENVRDVGLNLKCRLFRLDGHDDFVTHEQILTHLQNTEVVLRAFEQNGIVPPGKIPPEFAMNIRSYYTQSVSYANNNLTKAAYREQLVNLLKETLKLYDAKNDRLKANIFYDTGLSKKENAKRPDYCLNRVTTSHLTRMSSRVESVYIKAKHKDAIESALNKTDYLYSVSPIYGEDLNKEFLPWEMHGSKDKNDTRRFVLSYDGYYSREVRQICEKVLYPQLFQMDFKAFRDYYSPLERIHITDGNVADFVRLCNEKRVPYIYDNQGDISCFDALPIAYPETEKGKMDSILQTLSRKSEERLLSKDGLLKETDVLTEKDIMNGTVITPEMKDRVRLCGKSLDEIPIRYDDHDDRG